jgi:hypothetical protein
LWVRKCAVSYFKLNQINFSDFSKNPISSNPNSNITGDSLVMRNHRKMREQMRTRQRDNFNRKSCELRKSVERVSKNNVATNIMMLDNNTSHLEIDHINLLNNR